MMATKLKMGLMAGGLALTMGVGAQMSIPRAHIYPTVEEAPANIQAALDRAKEVHDAQEQDTAGGNWQV